ncbi:hypothetical protein BN1723_016301 [Verticillium longisporum]|uniref:Uncharacterized protein n=1 Tax=Verticillium longisporum TaxID=100787 RepID=A0A0G4NC32_VERLO|nr:hypothetical protein HYQ46_012416 [Verticillium longisporum]CRK32678.1 hypothetical protein BN1708_016135 [Verticillium longisporum]CRK44022.1 hypothetical protein BN1723_016301 [Verticillium longisporum]
MKQQKTSSSLPSARWTSFQNWDYNGMKERLLKSLATLDKDVLLRHAERIKGQRLTMSDPFSAGQSWICFEMIAEDASLVIARVRLPRHPDILSTVTEEDENYSIACEVSTMQFVAQNLPAVVVPKVYAYEGSGSQLATDAGAIYMLLEGFYGNTLQDIALDLCILPVATQKHIMAQWTMVQVQLATLAFPQIGSISDISESGAPVIGKLSVSASEGLVPQGPFSTSTEYFTATGEAALRKAELQDRDSSHFNRLGALVFIDIVRNTGLFRDSQTCYPLNHMDLGTQNIIVDDKFNFLCLIDWEFAQAAPWQVNHYPMPFPLVWPDEKIKSALDDPRHVAHRNMLRQDFARKLYSEKFREAEFVLRAEGRYLERTFAEVLESPASRIYACFTKLQSSPGKDASHVREMVRLAFGLDNAGTDQYLEGIV